MTSDCNLQNHDVSPSTYLAGTLAVAKAQEVLKMGRLIMCPKWGTPMAHALCGGTHWQDHSGKEFSQMYEAI